METAEEYYKYMRECQQMALDFEDDETRQQDFMQLARTYLMAAMKTGQRAPENVG